MHWPLPTRQKSCKMRNKPSPGRRCPSAHTGADEGRHMEDSIKSRRIAQTLRKNQTKEENHLWYDFLKTYPVQFKRQYPVGCYYVDFYCFQAKLVVELDGSQHFTNEAVIYDKKRSQYLEEQGLQVLRISNSDIWRNFAGVCQTIDAHVQKRME